MNAKIGDPKKLEVEFAVDDEVDAEEAQEEEADDSTVVLDDTGIYTDNVGDVSVEINVEELIAELEATSSMDVARRKEIRRRLEELAEEKALEDTYAVDFDDKLD